MKKNIFVYNMKKKSMLKHHKKYSMAWYLLCIKY